jgi:hypothetical protein
MAILSGWRKDKLFSSATNYFFTNVTDQDWSLEEAIALLDYANGRMAKMAHEFALILVRVLVWVLACCARLHFPAAIVWRNIFCSDQG